MSPYHYLALDVKFGGKCAPADHGLAYRKNKSVADVHAAVRKAHLPKNGMLKNEVELSMLELYLKDIFKNTSK